MNTANIKKYAPKARIDFQKAIKARANKLGIYADHIEPLSVSGDVMQIGDKQFPAGQKSQRDALERQVNQDGFEAVMDLAASTWFNRLCAIRFMELKEYLDHGYRVLSHPELANGFQILEHTADVAEELGLNHAEVLALSLQGDKEEELYRSLLLAQCNSLHDSMDFLFDRVDDVSALLLPDGLTRTDSILRPLVDNVPEEDWQQVEVIGWLYQFYITEKKDEVIGKVVKSEDIPAATQLFTPNWIVQYLVQNSVGRQWLQTYPDSSIKAGMPYYIEPAEQSDEVNAQLAEITPDTLDPESIKVLDPACGSGHILVEAYNTLKSIYDERGYKARDIPKLILENNLYGLDIDDRAAQLAGFALMMMAREDDRRIFQRVKGGEVNLNIFSLQSTVGMDVRDVWDKLNLGGSIALFDTPDLFVDINESVEKDDKFYVLLSVLIKAFSLAKTLGALIDLDKVFDDKITYLDDLVVKCRLKKNKLFKEVKQGIEHGVSVLEVESLIAELELAITKHNKSLVKLRSVKCELPILLLKFSSTLKNKIANDNDASKLMLKRVLHITTQASVLVSKYDVVVANPPYMGSKGMNSELKKIATSQFFRGKHDLFAMFIERCIQLSKVQGFSALITMQSWMFLSSYESLRRFLLEKNSLCSLVQIGKNSFPSLNSKVAQAAMFVFQKQYRKDWVSQFIDLNSVLANSDKDNVFIHRTEEMIYEVNNKVFKCLPGASLAYWLSEKERCCFQLPRLEDNCDVRQGLATGNDEKFIRHWFEVNKSNIKFDSVSLESATQSKRKWFPLNKGGEMRRWYGNQELVINWQNDGQDLKEFVSARYGNFTKRLASIEYYFKSGITWSLIGSAQPSFRLFEEGSIISHKGPGIFSNDIDPLVLLGYLNSNVASKLLNTMTTGTSFEVGHLKQLPMQLPEGVAETSAELLNIYKEDWNLSELSWGFIKSPLFAHREVPVKLKELFENFQLMQSDKLSRADILYQMNDKFYEACFGLEGLSASECASSDLKVIDRTSEALNLLSYSIGCMMGRYSLDRDGLVYANAGNEGFTELEDEGTYRSFPADDDGIIPLTDLEWFSDDAAYHFRDFVRTAWGEEHLQENLDFVAESLCLHAIKPKRGESSLETIRRYLSTQFYKDHLKTYKKRPIYWLFSSGKQKAFECLVYLHRYNEGTLSRMRTEYVTPLIGKYDARLSQLEQQLDSASTSEQTKLNKEISALEKKQSELRSFGDKLKHRADMRISLDLDDGVKVNYGKFGDLLAEVKAVHGKVVNSPYAKQIF